MKEISIEDRIRRLKLSCTINDNGVERHFHNGYEYVKIGGLKWAKCNVGAEKETDSGLYFAWGDTQGYTAKQVGEGEGQKRFNWGDYKFREWENLIKYNNDHRKIVLEFEDDSARANMGGSWRMPTKEEILSLIENTIGKRTEINGVRGRKFISKSDNTKYVFFPAAGFCLNGSVNLVDSYGRYWSSSLFGSDVRVAYSMYFFSSNVYWQDYSYRNIGFSVRAVLD